MSTTRKELIRYYRAVGKELLCPAKTQKKIITDLKLGVSNYLNENPEVTIDHIYSIFGTPQQIAASYVEELPTPELIQKIKLRKIAIKGVIAVVSIAAVICIAVTLINVFRNADTATGEQQNAEQYIDPVYPPHYETVYKELMGVDLNTAIAALGYKTEDFTLIDHPTFPYYRCNKTVTYLGHEFQVELWLRANDTQLFQVRLYSELSGTTEDQAKAGVELLHTLRKMFGLHLASKDEDLEKKYLPEEATVAKWLSGEEEKLWGAVWETDYYLAHIPDESFHGKPSRGSCAFTLTYQMVYDPEINGAYLALTYGIGAQAGNNFVK